MYKCKISKPRLFLIYI
ncbi:hypothetical protein Avbf_13328 [Armadillidium vulgare]|nr:hypothetical protein Avbf_13328 [Armadillidium vulgare]